MTAIVIYTKDWCGYCRAATQLLTKLGYKFEEIDVTHDLARYEEMRERSGRRTVPQIFIDGVGVGGYDEFSAMARKQQLPPP